MSRAILDKTAIVHGYRNFAAYIKRQAADAVGIWHARLVNILSHGNYSLYEPRELVDENKAYFQQILGDFLERFPFNREMFPVTVAPTEAEDATAS